MSQLARTSACALLAIAGAAAMTSPAVAQSVPLATGGTYAFSKSEAILGGAPSALAAIMAQQSGSRAAPRPAIQPASYSRPAPQSADYWTHPDVSPGVANGRPDVFGTVALRVGRTPLDRRWRHVEQAGLSGAPARYAEALSDQTVVRRLEAVNAYVNRRVRFMDDYAHFGRADVWSAADDTLASGRGDCEDYAIAKLQMLRHAGVADRDLYLTIVNDLVRREDHAVLVVRAAGHMYVLDNGTDRLLDSEAISDYRPILTFTAEGTWTHGYRVRPAPVHMASSDAPPQPAADEGDQRSRSASLLAFNTGLSR